MINHLITNHNKRKINNKYLKVDDVENVNKNKQHNNLKDYAVSFIQGMSETQRARFKNMLENKIECGMSVAKLYGLDYREFISEVKKELGVE